MIKTDHLDHITELLNSALNVIEDGIHIIDERGITVFYSRSSERIECNKADNVLGKHITETYQLNDESSILLKVLKLEKPIENHQTTYLTKNGREVSILTNTYPAFADGRIIGAVSVNRDITGNKQLIDKVIQLQKQLNSNQTKNVTQYTFRDIIGESAAIQNTIQFAQRIALNMSPLLIYGETGTGKELFAQSIHNYSFRSGGPFVAVNCAAIPATLLESILFGTKKGAFTGAEDKPGLFEEADQGTLFLDEISSMDITLQSKLLRVLESKTVRRLGGKTDIKVNPRIISAINTDPQEAIIKQSLRQDLYYRLAVVTLTIPSLRERMSDIPLLAHFFISNINKIMNKGVSEISQEVHDIMQRHKWPGNIRELQHAVEHAMNYAEENAGILELRHLPPHLLHKYHHSRPITSDQYGKSCGTGSLKESLKQFESEAIRAALDNCDQNITKAAAALGMSRQNLQQRIRRLGLF